MPPMHRVVHSRSEQETHALGVALGRAAFPGTLIALHGDLGAGKTVLARGIGEGLGIRRGVRSPTFLLVQEHDGGRLRLYHADWYRLEDPDALEQLGVADLWGDGVWVVEWADRFPEALPADRLEIRFSGSGTARRLHLTATGPAHAPFLEAVGG